MSLRSRLTEVSITHHRAVTGTVIGAAVIVALLAAAPLLWPAAGAVLHKARVDTDPENMLPRDEPARLFHHEMKQTLALHDMVVVGVVNETHPDGVFNPESLARVHELTEFAKGLHGEAIGLADGEGVIPRDVIAPSVVDSVEQVAGQIRIDWLMRHPPKTPQAAREVRRKALRIPFLNGTVVSGDGKAVCLYLPLTSKDLSYRVYSRLREKIQTFDGDEKYYVTGLPVAEDTFGVEMFVQMAISAPLAMIVIFGLMLAFFRKPVIVISPMIVAMVSVILTMGLLIIAGHPVHIMSSMIPIFIMPIAVLDSIHIISEFFERYQATRDRRRTILAVMDELFGPMLYTSLTSAAGFASLALTPIPPVQVFGVFVAVGIMAAWLLTVTFIPAYVMFISPKTLEKFGAVHVPAGPGSPEAATGGAPADTAMARALGWVGGRTYRWAKPILIVAALALAGAAWGIVRIQVNDNPVKWFTKSHPIRQADRVLNDHFGGTYMAYLALRHEGTQADSGSGAAELAETAKDRAASVRSLLAKIALAAGKIAAADRDAFLEKLETQFKPDLTRATDEQLAVWRAAKAFLDAEWNADGPEGAFAPKAFAAGLAQRAGRFAREIESAFESVSAGARGGARPVSRPAGIGETAWEEAELLLAEHARRGEVFKRPDVLGYLSGLQEAMDKTGVVGKSSSLADLVQTIHRDLVSGTDADYRVPSNKPTVAQCIDQFLNSNRPDDLWHFVTGDYRTAGIWVQLTSGDNRDMEKVVRAAERHVADNPPPVAMKIDWFGLTYINVIWQNRMVKGMAVALMGSFLVVFLLMTILFRSALWGLLSMIPLTVTIAGIYGVIGFIGKDYDMPVAVLSSLTLGLAVDFAIHFLARGRSMYEALGSWRATAPAVFGEPARAIARNIIVIAAGFLPLLAASLLPYRTVGMLLAAILLVSGVGTLLILPALMRVLEKLLFPRTRRLGVTCNCMTCLIFAAALAALVALNLRQYADVGWNVLATVSAGIVVAAGVLCRLSARRQACNLAEPNPQDRRG